MKRYTIALSCLTACALSIPLEVTLSADTSPAIFEETIFKRQDDYNWQYICQYVTPDTNMPLRDEANAIADYLTNLGESACGMERPQGSNDPVYQNLAYTGNTEVNLYFTNKEENKWAYKVDYYCNYLGTYLKSLVNACTSNGSKAKVQGAGYTEIPNCPNLQIVWIVSTPSAEGGGAIEILPKGTRHGKKIKRSVLGEIKI